MGHNDHINYELHDRIEDLVGEGIIEEKSASYGVALQVIYNGYGSLSPEQRALYDAVIAPALQKRSIELEMIRIMNLNLID